MKIRTDFVTNSSSSSFTLEIQFKLLNGKTISFKKEVDDDPDIGELYVSVSPKQLGTAKNISEMIWLLKQGVENGLWSDTEKFFEKNGGYFIRELESITSMDEIESVMIRGDEENYVSYRRSYLYDRVTGQYDGVIEGNEFEKDGDPGGDLTFDTSGCYILCPDYNSSRDISTTKERVAEYYKPRKGEYPKWFAIRYTNSVIDEIFKRFSYTSVELKDPFDIELEGTLPGYCGVNTIEALTATLINYLVAFGKADSGFEDELRRRKDEIQKAFSSIEGTSIEISVSIGLYDIWEGYDFELDNGVYRATYRTCVGGW